MLQNKKLFINYKPTEICMEIRERETIFTGKIRNCSFLKYSFFFNPKSFFQDNWHYKWVNRKVLLSEIFILFVNLMLSANRLQVMREAFSFHHIRFEQNTLKGLCVYFCLPCCSFPGKSL